MAAGLYLMIRLKFNLKLTKVLGNSDIPHSCFPIFKFRIGELHPFLSINTSFLHISVEIVVEMYRSQNVPENYNKELLSLITHMHAN